MSRSLAGGSDHPSWLTATGTLVGYGVILVVMTVALFLVPYLLFAST